MPWAPTTWSNGEIQLLPAEFVVSDDGSAITISSPVVPAIVVITTPVVRTGSVIAATILSAGGAYRPHKRGCDQ